MISISTVVALTKSFLSFGRKVKFAYGDRTAEVLCRFYDSNALLEALKFLSLWFNQFSVVYACPSHCLIH